jgi:hypothetical protein
VFELPAAIGARQSARAEDAEHAFQIHDSDAWETFSEVQSKRHLLWAPESIACR